MRQAMPGIVVLLVAGHPADAASYRPADAASYRIVSPVTACIDPRSTLALSDAALSGAARVGQRSPAWRGAVQRQGHCVAIEPGAHWERILGAGPLMLLRRTPPMPGLPPLYFPAGSASLVPDGKPAPDQPDPGPANSVAAAGPPAQEPEPATDAAGAADSPIRTEPLPAPATATPPSTFPSAFPSTQAEALPMPGSQGDADVSLMDVTTNSATLGRAMQQGYVVGFAAAMLLIVLLLAIVAGIAWAILRNTRLSRAARLPGHGPHATAGLSPALLAGAAPTATRRIVLSDETRHLETTPAHPASRASPQPSHPELALPPATAPPPADATDFGRHCIALLDKAGWQTSVRPIAGQGMPDLVAERDGRVMALQCLPVEPAVDEEAVDCACMARERQQADSAAIVSDASFTAPAKRLALQAGIALLHADELAAFAA
ncbi:restriction endonuclease [Lichenicoccus sp.]|uniref:restriction endonuclease n=1 Tax=Lichenicoccus sp. TaxID=2781899 RepID=UPI003D12B78D